MTEEDISNFMKEIDRQGLVLGDPHCLQHDFVNFCFLEDYHDANLCGASSYEDLPEWFKKRPLVLYDIDMVTRKREKE